MAPRSVEHPRCTCRTHALARICNADCKRLSGNVSEWLAHGPGKGFFGTLQATSAEFSQEVARIPISERIAMQPTKDGQFDITSSCFLLMNPIWQQCVVDLICEFYPQRRVHGHPYYVDIVLHALMTCTAKLQTLWHYKAWLTNAQVEDGKGAAARLGRFWEMLRWKAMLWAHWVVAHCGFYMERNASIYLFSSIPTEFRISRLKVELRNCFKG